jgi:hypothetical protein
LQPELHSPVNQHDVNTARAPIAGSAAARRFRGFWGLLASPWAKFDQWSNANRPVVKRRSLGRPKGSSRLTIGIARVGPWTRQLFTADLRSVYTAARAARPPLANGSLAAFTPALHRLHLIYTLCTSQRHWRRRRPQTVSAISAMTAPISCAYCGWVCLRRYSRTPAYAEAPDRRKFDQPSNLNSGQTRVIPRYSRTPAFQAVFTHAGRRWRCRRAPVSMLAAAAAARRRGALGALPSLGRARPAGRGARGAKPGVSPGKNLKSGASPRGAGQEGSAGGRGRRATNRPVVK